MTITWVCLWFCSCDRPCCEVDIGVGTMTCGSQHCEVHGLHRMNGEQK